MSQNGNIFTLNVPYFEYGSGTSKVAFSARLTTNNLLNFNLDAASVASSSVVANALQPSTIAAAYRRGPLQNVFR